MRDQCAVLFKQARQELESVGLLNEVKEGKKANTSQVEEVSAADIDKEFETLQGKTGVETITKLEELLAKSHTLKHGSSRMKRVKMVKSELMRARRSLNTAETSQSDLETEVTDVKVSPQTTGTSPTGINRRTAVLFTRKAQAALRKPNEDKEEKESPILDVSPQKS